MSGELTGTALFTFWTHALAAGCFAALLMWRLKERIVGRDQLLLLAAFLMTAAWAWLAAIEGPTAPLPMLAETTRDLIWIALLYGLATGDREADARNRGMRLVLGAEGLAIGLQLILDLGSMAAVTRPEFAAASTQAG